MKKGPTIKLYNSDGGAVDGVVDCCITDYSTTHEEWSQEVSKDGGVMKNNWTRDLPIEDGVYWLKICGRNANPVTLYCDSGHTIITTMGNDMEKELVENYSDDGWCEILVEDCEWQGPITPND